MTYNNNACTIISHSQLFELLEISNTILCYFNRRLINNLIVQIFNDNDVIR